MEGELWEQGDPSTSCLSEVVKSEGMREHVCVCTAGLYTWKPSWENLSPDYTLPDS